MLSLSRNGSLSDVFHSDLGRRAAVSVPSNIAEGKGRSSDKELVQFLCHARGSQFEVETQIGIAEKLAYVKRDESESFGAKLFERVRC
ncbi:MAG TPA: four helix bundle protein [Candidatus Sulfotelmatobacter sp.]|nr:four helix bundle protein [Candidatus Sulfotelmatobacter sp.]